MKSSELYKQILTEIEDIRLIDTHEHLLSEKIRLGQKIDFFNWLTTYPSRDIVSAGLSTDQMERLLDSERPLDQRWSELSPFWKYIRTTGYGRALLLAARELFDIPDINETTYQELSQKISASNQGGWYNHVLKEQAKIDLAILNIIEFLDPTPLEEVDHCFFAPVLCMDDLLTPCNIIDITTIERKTGTAIHCIDDMLKAMDCTFERAVTAGVVGVKIDLAYRRSLNFERTTKSEAERVFNQLRRYPYRGPMLPIVPPVSWGEAKPLHDYLVHQMIHRSIELQLPIQIHTGLQSGNANFLTDANPLHLVNLLVEYREAKFDLFHVGYPYLGEMATLGKNFPSVYVDMCWLYMLSPWVARQTLHELIETIPCNKIFAFGGDHFLIEGAYSHARMARESVARVLTEKVEDRYLSEDEAMVIAHRLLRDNAIQFFDISTYLSM
jgi:predicted TIM-barrel fold metal-dependent hydrolase